MRTSAHGLTQDMLCVVGGDGNWKWADDEWGKALGFAAADLVSRPLAGFIHPDERDRARAALHEAAAGGKAALLENRFVCRDGGFKRIAWKIVPARGAGLLYGVGRDLARCDQCEQALQEGEGFLANVFASVQDGISVLDREMRILLVNATMERWYAHAMPIVGKKCYEAYHSRRERCEICPTCRALQTNEACCDIVPLRGVGGKITGWLELFSFPLRDMKTGEVKGVIEYVRDISARKKLEAVMLQSEKVSAMGKLAAGVAHELNNPLGIVLGFSQSALQRLPQGHELEGPLKAISRETNRCKDLVLDLLAYSRCDQPEIEALDINRAVRESISLILPRAKMGQIEVMTALAENLPKISGNKNQIQQIVVNLANNACDALPRDGVLTIATEMQKDGPRTWVRLKVSDTGAGIPPHVLPKIFEPFFTTKPEGQGAGLGLAIVDRIVRRHSGTLDVASRPGLTEFLVAFPAAQEAKRGDG